METTMFYTRVFYALGQIKRDTSSIAPKPWILNTEQVIMIHSIYIYIHTYIYIHLYIYIYTYLYMYPGALATTWFSFYVLSASSPPGSG